MRDWRKLPDAALLTLDECADISGYSKGTLYSHRYAGLLPFVPGRPIQIRVADFKVYLNLISEGVKDKLHRTLKIHMDDRAAYSCLQTVPDFTAKRTEDIIEDVIRETQTIWRRYKDEEAKEISWAKKRMKRSANKKRKRKRK